MASAYTLCLSTSKRSNESRSTLKFAIRRYFRIAPVYYLGIILYFFVFLFYNKLKFGHFIISESYNFTNLFCNLTFIHGFYPPANNNIVPGGWSIGTEMAFYAIFPLLYKISQSQLKSIKDIALFIVFGIVFSQLILFTLHLNGHSIMNDNFLYYNMINQLPVFFLGIGFYYKNNLTDWSGNWLFNILFFILFSFISILIWHSGNDYYFSITPIISGFSFIFLMQLFQKYDFINTKLLVRIGQLSYSMYILHFIFANYIKGLFMHKFENFNGFFSLIFFYVFTVFFTFISALLFEKYVEKPSIELGRFYINKLDAKNS